MARKDSDTKSLDLKLAAELIETHWQTVVAEASAKSDIKYVANVTLRKAIEASINYVFDFFDFARSVLALGGESIRITFLQKVGEHLDLWNTQPSHRQAWKGFLESV